MPSFRAAAQVSGLRLGHARERERGAQVAVSRVVGLPTCSLQLAA